MEKQQKAVGDGPSSGTRRPSDTARYEHFEHQEHARSPTHKVSEEEFLHLENVPTDHSRLAAEAPILDEHDVHESLRWSSIRTILREPFAEFFGVFIMILFGDGSVAQVLLSGGQKSAPGMNGFGAYQSISWGWGLGVMLGIYVAGDSGGFLNPAVTFCFCLFRKLPWRRFPIYFLAQFLGGFVGSGIVYANYINAINQFEGHGIRTVPPATTATAGIFCTYPQAFMTKASQFFSEFIASAILMFVIFALKDDSNPGAMGKTGAGPLFPLALFFLIFGLGACFGWETGYAINLARDFGPRLMSYIVGYGHDVWSAGGYYFWIPMVAPFCGCTFGAFLYDMFVYTGPETPLNKPWFGFKYLLKGRYWREKRKQQKYEV
ncbi:related to channel proteins [Phialocephala subalpina]|uniref:Related to channel proteins n=1 Tax=Phialocephala subalpina TaxID=576137 RepID=A0A1L7XKY4_9HELO|nr:related to channel proteins [Phialocephala subalpina]